MKALSSKTPRQPTAFGIGLIALDLLLSADATKCDYSSAGGTCGNVLTILSFLGWAAYPIARLNGDSASRKVKADFRRWGLRLDFATCTPTSSTPIIVQEIRRDKSGMPKHRFSWSCPHCGNWLPSFRAVTTNKVEEIKEAMGSPQIFFMDRLSRASLTLAQAASERGALVMYEYSSRSDERLLGEALEVAHIVKYSEDRFGGFSAGRPSSSVLLEIQTLGKEGLRFRSWIPDATAPVWTRMPALPPLALIDTCGAGDWCTAGLLAQLGSKGLSGFRAVGTAELLSGLNYGQALAAWNCGFEGARGGMYQVELNDFDQDVNRILHGTSGYHDKAAKIKRRSSRRVSCPACPPPVQGS